jgi:uncharacterized protein (TIGR03435 family)
MKLLGTICMCLLLTSASLFAQKPEKLAFEVASIKPAPSLLQMAADIQSGKARVGMRMDGARIDLSFISLRDLVVGAFKVKPNQISGPDWLISQRFEIHAKLPEGATKEQIPEMMQTLLSERFKFAFHRENKELPVYALIVSKGGPKLKEAVEEPATPAPADDAAKAPAPKEKDSRELMSVDTPEGSMKMKQQGNTISVDAGKAGKMRMVMGENGAMNMEFAKMKMSEFAELLTTFTDRQVVDMTELTGAYQLALELPMEELLSLAKKMMPELAMATGGGAAPGGAAPSTGLGGVAASDPSGSSIFRAVQQLGLKLDARKVPTDMIIIDHIEKDPTED